MFEKFTERARRVMGHSRAEAQRLGSEFIGTEHMLLGILHEGGGLAARVLYHLDAGYKRARQQIEMIVAPRASPDFALGQLPFSPSSKRAIELASEASMALGHDLIGTEHLLIGLVDATEGTAAKVLTNLGLGLDDVRRKVLEAIGEPDPPATVREATWSDRTRSVVQQAASEAVAMRSSRIEPEHLILAILGRGGPLSDLLAKRGVQAGDVRSIIK